MASEEAFLCAIRETPDVDAPRLAYADWLEGRGDLGRAEFIRVQCQRAQLSDDDPRTQELLACEQVLLDLHGREWVGPLEEYGEEWRFQRGLVVAGTIAAWCFRDKADILFSLAPLLEEVRLVGIPLSDAFTAPQMERLTALNLSGNSLGLWGVAALTWAEARLSGLRHLNLANNGIGQPVQGHASDFFPASPGAKVGWCSDHHRTPGEWAVLTLMSSRLGDQLTHLNLAANALGDDAARCFSRFREWCGDGECCREVDSRWRRLVSLDLQDNGITDPDLTEDDFLLLRDVEHPGPRPTSRRCRVYW